MAAEAISDKTATSEFWLGVKAGLPVVLAAAPFGLLFGALAVDNGLSVLEATLMSAAIFGGASQMVGIELFGQKIAPWLIVLSIFAVNFRHVLYSAAIGRRISHWPAAQQAIAYFFLTDPQFAEAERKAEDGEKVGFAWYIGMALAIYVPWVAESWTWRDVRQPHPRPACARASTSCCRSISSAWSWSFRNRPLWLPVVAVSAVASVIAYKTVGSPWHVSIGAAAGILLAAAMPSAPVRPAGKIATEERRRMSTTLWIILWGAVVTYLTRIGGHLVLSRFEHIHPRVEAGLNAVPAAVLTTLVAPAAMLGRTGRIDGAWRSQACVMLRAGMLAMFLAGAVVLIALRQLIG